MSSFSCSSKIIATANYNHCVLLMYMCLHVQMQKYRGGGNMNTWMD